MTNLLDYILDLFRDETQAQAFLQNSDQALADAGLSNVTSAQIQTVAATAVPSLALSGGGDALVGLQQAVAGHYGFDGFDPVSVPQSGLELASNNSFLSPTTSIQDDHSLSFGVGDITLGDKTSAHGDGAVAIGGSNHGDIVSGDGAALGNGNTAISGDIHAGSGSTVAVGHGNNVATSHDGTVIQTSGHETTTSWQGDTTTTAVHGNGTVADIHGPDSTFGVDDSTHLTHASTIDDSSHDGSVHDTAVTDHSTHDASIHQTTHMDGGMDGHLAF
jgi:hypothetical protein